MHNNMLNNRKVYDIVIRRKICILVVLFALLFVNGWAQEPVYLDTSKPIEVCVKDALEEKVALCHDHNN